ncbi:MAG: EamA family transporter [Meiothermus sp.]|nr:EamA family transporter [Meiothermus sp.]
MLGSGVPLIVASAFGFATLGIFGKLAFEQGWDSQTTLFWRFLAAALLLWGVIALRGWPEGGVSATGGTQVARRAAWRAVWVGLGLGAVGMTVQVLLYFAALERLSAGLTALLLYTYPIHVVLLAWWLERRPPSAAALTAMALAFLGIVLASDLSGQVSLLGVVIALLTAMWYAIYLTVSSRVARHSDPLLTSASLFVGVVISIGILLALRGGLDIPQGLQGWGIVLGVASVATVMPIVFLYAGLARLSATQVSLLSTLEPVFVVAMGFLILGERLSPLQILGAVLVLFAVVLLQRK